MFETTTQFSSTITGFLLTYTAMNSDSSITDSTGKKPHRSPDGILIHTFTCDKMGPAVTPSPKKKTGKR